jgi:hypothetical protein
MKENRASLDEIGRKAGTDKSSAHHDYLQFYERFFSTLRDSPINLLEVGVFHGASLRMWEEYFPHGSVVGADIDRAAVRFRTDRTAIEIVDQSNIQNLIDLGVKRGPFDIVIDDGSHLWEHQITTLRTLFPFVKPGGFYVVEDLQTNFGELATNYRGISSVTCVEYLKQLVDLRLGDEQIDIQLEEDPFLRTFGRMTEYIAFTRHACLIQKRNISRDPFISAPLRAVDVVDQSPILGLVGHIGNFGDVVNDGAAFINIPDSFSGAIQGFQLTISSALERQIEYRGRLPDGSWTDWQPGNSFVGSRRKHQSLIGAAARLNGDLQKEFNVELLCKFENSGDIHAAGTGEDCTIETGAQPLRGLQVVLSRPAYRSVEQAQRAGSTDLTVGKLTPSETKGADPGDPSFSTTAVGSATTTS